MSATYYIGVDGSGPSRAALRWGVRRAAERNADVVLVNTVDDEWGLVGRDAAADAERQAKELLIEESARVTALHSGVPLTTRIVHGGTAWALATLPSPEDLLIVGTHKTGFLRGRVLGSRSVQIASAARCSVAIVPDTTLDSRHDVVVGVDGTDGALSAVRLGAQEAARLDQDLLLVYAPPGLPRSESSRSDPVEDRSPQAARMLQDAATEAATMASRITVRRRVAHRDPAEALLDASFDAALLILGVSTRHGENTLIGSVTHDVLMNINVPVLIARGLPARSDTTSLASSASA
ncbi:nucleotide-binding universal stress UspA family protein [Cryobacterium sp. MP_3.1]|uniref:universal stress protein n=1 Tax=Cryobacterium sp. MP_3.1 TaxID=3071711 RepID=UPI002E03C524|nr:nucleotide-binding universal stress UspA family protein [Cryobacterium sp. MP_3.1]